MVSIAPPATTFYLTQWTPFWLDLEPRCTDMAAGLRTISTDPGTVHDLILRVGSLLGEAADIRIKHPLKPSDAAVAALEDGDLVRVVDPWLEGTKQDALKVVVRVLLKHPPSVEQVQEMRARIAVFDRSLGMVQVLFIGLRRGTNVALFGATIDGGFAIRELGTLRQGLGSGYVLERGREKFEVEIMFWSDTELMAYIEPFASSGFELIGTPIIIMCPPVPSDYAERLRWAERFIDDGLGMCVVT